MNQKAIGETAYWDRLGAFLMLANMAWQVDKGKRRRNRKMSEKVTLSGVLETMLQTVYGYGLQKRYFRQFCV